MQTIDHILNIKVSDALWNNELVTLTALTTGLSYLATKVAQLEVPFKSSGKTAFAFGFGFLPDQDEELLTCYFHWYGTTLLNYGRLVGFMSGVEAAAYPRDATRDPANYPTIRRYCDKYVASVPELEAITVWRNKVFAHFALTSPRQNDTPALLDLSVLSPITFMDGRLRVGGTISAIAGEEAQLPAWSVTETHEALRKRYWP
jgi:hypothetical protein